MRYIPVICMAAMTVGLAFAKFEALVFLSTLFTFFVAMELVNSD